MWRIPYIKEEVAADMLETLLERLGDHLANSGVEHLVVESVYFSFVLIALFSLS